MIREIEYKDFSFKTHKKNWQAEKPNVAQFELTFNCGLRCKHCYTDCYNKPAYHKKELSAKQIKYILDKIYNSGIIWLCFTGGDPLVRRDFLGLYSYARNKGFIITIFTNGYSMTEEIAGHFKERPPFVVEMTLNAAAKDLYEKISQVKGSYVKAIKGIEMMLKAGIPLKIKTQVTRDNFAYFPKIKKFIEGFGLNFRPSFDLYPRLSGDLAPCYLRVSPQEILELNGNKQSLDNDCHLSPSTQHPAPNTNLFRCAIGGGDGITIDPYGNTFTCNLIRKPLLNLLKVDVEDAQNSLLPLVRDKKFTTNSKCSSCKLIRFCWNCPGRAYLESSDMEAPIDYYCKLSEKYYGSC